MAQTKAEAEKVGWSEIVDLTKVSDKLSEIEACAVDAKTSLAEAIKQAEVTRLATRAHGLWLDRRIAALRKQHGITRRVPGR